ncbi:hypothetical protein F383_38405 [Gossypium arboreum]|uniref:Uncharacterized protein n=1 Tax=Gossypium arboreum TaxID=29729 RepID=A0A0B0MEZ8_GOSAR|nr:hypothetical protein F383_38405 [Gossypium arboreum]
MSGTSASLL